MAEYIKVSKEIADLLAAKVAYRRQLNAEITMETAVFDSLVSLAVERNDQVIESAGVQKQTSPEISSLASGYMGLKSETVIGLVSDRDYSKLDALTKDIRRIAASVVSQDETKGS